MKKASIGVVMLILAITLASGLKMVNNHRSASTNDSQNNRENKKTLKEKKARQMAIFDQEIQMTKDPSTGVVPYERIVKAKEYAKNLIAKSSSRKAAINGVNWTNAGPDNVGGRTRTIMFDPNDTSNKRVFAGAISGGIWKNEDITTDQSPWTKVNDFLENLAVSSIVADPVTPTTFYAATGEAYSQVTPGIGLFKSTDGGATWIHITTTSQFKYVAEVLVRVENQQSVIYLASKKNFVGSSIAQAGMSNIGLDGLFRSSDGGSTWTQVIPNNNMGFTPSVDDIGLDSQGHLWAATGENEFGEKGGNIYECTDGSCDATSKFVEKYNPGQSTLASRTVIALAPNNPNVIYAVAGKEPNPAKQDIEYFIKSTDSGATWSTLTIPTTYNLDNCVPEAAHFTNGQATYDLCMTVHPTNSNFVLLGGIDMYRTFDGFATTQHISSWYAGSTPCDQVSHADHHAIVFRPGASDEVVLGNDGGVYFTTTLGDIGTTSPSYIHQVKNYNVSQLYAADISPTAGAAEYLGGLQDNGTQDWDAATGASTAEAIGGDGAYSHIDQNEPMTQIGAYIYNDYTYTNDEWVNKIPVSTFGAAPQTGRFINPTDYDDTNNILYAASNADQLCRLSDVGAASPSPLQDGIVVGGAGLGGKQATTIRVDRNTPTTIYVGTDGGKIYKIENANTGTSFTSTDISGSLPVGWVSSIDIQNGNSLHMLATISNFGVNSVWESMDGGSLWTSVEGNLPDMPIRFGVFSPANSDHAFLATDLGVWSTDNLNGGTTNWGVTNTGLANVRVDMLQYRTSDTTMMAATFGRGLYTYKVSGGVVCPDNLTVTDNPAMGDYQAALTLQTNTLGPVQIASQATFKAGNSVQMNKEFEVMNTATSFEVQMVNCNN